MQSGMGFVPVNIRFDNSDANYKEHKHWEGNHNVTQQDGSVLPNTDHWHLGSNSLSRMPVHPSAPLLVLRCPCVEDLPTS